MFSFLNTLEILPVEQVNLIAETLGSAGLDAAILLKARTGVPGFISLNAWVAHQEPICQSIATDLVCCTARREELNDLLRDFIGEIHAAMENRLSEVSGSALRSGAKQKVRGLPSDPLSEES
jgi:hypothetical protein